MSNYNSEPIEPKKVIPILQEGKTPFYEAIIDDRLERRKDLTDAMHWFRPVDRLFKLRQVKYIDGFLERIEPVLQQSRADDEILAAIQQPQPTFTEPDLNHNTAAETTVAVVEHS